MDSFDELLEGDAEIELVGSAAACKGVLVIAFCTYRPPDGRYIFQENITRDLNIPH
jgi:hypothetical protein